MAGAIIGLVGAIKLLNIGRDLTNWSKSIGDAFGIIRSDADKASTAVGTEKSGLRGRLGALKKVGKIAITIVALYEGFEFISGLMDGGAGKNRLDTNKDNRVDNNERR
ncbi:hypothetical protein ACIGG9_24845 [Pseudonocardia alni]|uniref:hypothetical protein n=1 Tax=Pseudonocardia alni TaxID=33907 RepID=UPI0033CF15E5